MKDNVINVNFTARHKRKIKLKNYIIVKFKNSRVNFPLKVSTLRGQEIIKIIIKTLCKNSS